MVVHIRTDAFCLGLNVIINCNVTSANGGDSITAVDIGLNGK